MNWWIYQGSHGTYVVDGPAVWANQKETCPGVEDNTPKAAVQKAWREGCKLDPAKLHPLQTHIDQYGLAIAQAWEEARAEASKYWANGQRVLSCKEFLDFTDRFF